MKTRAAVLHDAHKPFEIMELDLDAPKDGEVLIRYVAAGLCHSDLHLIDGDLVPRFPIVGGHEGAGIIEEVGPGVTKVKPGDHVVPWIRSTRGTRTCGTARTSAASSSTTRTDALVSWSRPSPGRRPWPARPGGHRQWPVRRKWC